MLTLMYRNPSVHHAHVPFISAHCIPVSLICYQETGIFTKMLSSVPVPLGNVPGKAVCMVYENSSCRLQWPKLTNNGAFQSKCVICLHRRESGLNTDTDSAHTPHISRDEILPHIEAVFTALSNSFWIGLDKQSTDRHFLCEYSDERVCVRVNSRALTETGNAIKSPHLIARGGRRNQNHIS